MTRYLTLDDVLAIRDKVMEETGGRKGILDFPLLHSAIERPKATFGGEELYPKIFDKAAALIHSLIQNRPFNDGNKRTALSVTVRFLYINGYNLKHPEDETVQFTLDIQKKNTSLEKIADWLKTHSLLLST